MCIIYRHTWKFVTNLRLCGLILRMTTVLHVTKFQKWIQNFLNHLHSIPGPQLRRLSKRVSKNSLRTVPMHISNAFHRREKKKSNPALHSHFFGISNPNWSTVCEHICKILQLREIKTVLFCPVPGEMVFLTKYCSLLALTCFSTRASPPEICLPSWKRKKPSSSAGLAIGDKSISLFRIEKNYFAQENYTGYHRNLLSWRKKCK